MSEATAAARPVGIIAKTAWRLAVSLAIAIAVWLLLLTHRRTSPSTMLVRLVILAASATMAFAVFDVWPRRLPHWCQRWVMQVVAVGASIPIAASAMYAFAPLGAPPFLEDNDWVLVTFAAMLVAPWTALAAIVRQKEAFAHRQTLAFALERSELERQAADVRLRLLQAQVAPHFLFNTLANVQALVEAGSPQAATVLRSLVAYLRGAVPLLHEPAATIERELELVRPYLELMQMRMPDRLRYAMNVDASVLQVRCPPTTVLTLVENAVRHGIDPSEEGGRIDIDIARIGDRCLVRVTDTGAGLRESANGLGTGLTALRERLQLVFGDAAHLRLHPNVPRGAAAEIEMPAEP